MTRTIAWAVEPSIAGITMQQVTPAAPLVIGGALKIGDDCRFTRASGGSVHPEEKLQ